MRCGRRATLALHLPSPITGKQLGEQCLVRIALPEFPDILLPVALDFSHELLEVRIAAQLVPVFIALEPGIVMVAELYSSTEEGERLPLLAKQRIHIAQGFRRVAIEDMSWLIAEDLGRNFVALTASSMQKRGKGWRREIGT